MKKWFLLLSVFIILIISCDNTESQNPNNYKEYDRLTVEEKIGIGYHIVAYVIKDNKNDNEYLYIISLESDVGCLSIMNKNVDTVAKDKRFE